MDVYAPLRELAECGGFVVLMGVSLDRMTLIHLAEEQAGRTLFRRWANDRNGEPAAAAVGGCSEGFGKFQPVLESCARRMVVGESGWTVYPASDALSLATEAIRSNPEITHCGNRECDRCNDAVQGGPFLSG